MTTPTLVTGDDFAIPVDLTVNGIAHAVSLGATVKAGIVSGDHATLWLDGVAQVSSANGASWSTGRVAVVFTKAQTALITTYGLALIEIQVEDVTTDSWFTPVRVVKGNIA